MSKVKLKKAFTLIELIVVIAIVGILLALGFIGFVTFRDYVAVANTNQGLKTAIRDAQDKSLTVSVNEVIDPVTQAITNEWVYGYRLEYDQSDTSTPPNQYKLYELIGPTIDGASSTPPSKDVVTSIRANFSNYINSCVLLGNDVTLKSLNPNIPVKCHYIKGYTFDSKFSSSNCNIFFTSVNGNISIDNGNSCYAWVKQNFKLQTLTFNNSGLGDVQICDDNVTTCP